MTNQGLPFVKPAFSVASHCIGVREWSRELTVAALSAAVLDSPSASFSLYK